MEQERSQIDDLKVVVPVRLKGINTSLCQSISDLLVIMSGARRRQDAKSW